MIIEVHLLAGTWAMCW